ncbi:MAG TPA: diguanylate cyclase [Noviherbaspirillum sp.]|uniref:GGDEF domain-containing protein n=1 Tax=Noviherbaspirillum sp. TaxID=1926288 RepID=UPI002D328DFC|nr:diguanylate cyclase [Noviherbaspirillum sp.]HYD94972.1 diguanylate cyclase [Noviherbaspirillum sp.]
MTIRLALFPKDEPEQTLRLKRFFTAAGAYLMNASFVVACWWMNYFGTTPVLVYLALVASIHIGFYAFIRSGWNKRLRDPSLTAPQLTIATLSGLYLMYHADDFRGIFLLLGVAMMVFGMFRFRTRQFAWFGLFLLAGYAGLIALLLLYRPSEIKLKVEVLQWLALLVTLMQFSFLAGQIGSLRDRLRHNNQELEKRNRELEVALQRISDMAIRDELTGVYNRHYLMERIEQESQRCVRSGSRYCVCMIDVDFFKKVNDTYGHLAGDRVLQDMAATVSAALRQTDFFGRFGGEEFVMVLTDTALPGALVSAERVRQTVEQIRFPDIDPGLKVTISIGIAEYVVGAPISRTFTLADRALYRAKENGRNRCECETDAAQAAA